MPPFNFLRRHVPLAVGMQSADHRAIESLELVWTPGPARQTRWAAMTGSQIVLWSCARPELAEELIHKFLHRILLVVVSECRACAQMDPAPLDGSSAAAGRGCGTLRLCAFAALTRPGRGNGLKNMQQRLEKMGGRCEIQSASGTGTEIKFFVSVPATARCHL